MLTPASPPLPGFGVGVVNPAAMGTHRFGGGDVFGQVYTCRGGFFDVAHARDQADLARYYHHWLTVGGRNVAGASIPGYFYTATVRMTAVVPPADVPSTAASMAYDEAIFHEVESYYNMRAGGHNSGFSPEDNVSNFLGAYIGGRALAAGGSYDAAVTAELNSLLTLLGARPPADTNAAFAAIVGKGIKGTGLGVLGHIDYLSRRNFDVAKIRPWLVGGAPGCGSTAWPAAVPQAFPAAIAGRYDTEFTVPGYAAPHVGATLKRSAFAAAIATIKADAGARYGATFETPWP